MRLAALRKAARIGTSDIDAGALASFNSADELDHHPETLTTAAGAKSGTASCSGWAGAMGKT
jgi:hypothetical protein